MDTLDYVLWTGNLEPMECIRCTDVVEFYPEGVPFLCAECLGIVGPRPTTEDVLCIRCTWEWHPSTLVVCEACFIHAGTPKEWAN